MSKELERPLSALDVIFTRRSVRSYAPQKVDEPTIRGLLDAAMQAPTALHAEPWVFVIVQDPKTLKRYSDRAKASWIHEAAGHADLHLPRDVASRSRFAEQLANPEFSVFYDAGTLIVIYAKAAGPFAVADCWLAAENLMLAACALGLGTCCIGSAAGAFNTPEAKTEFGVPSEMVAVAPIIVGVPSGNVPEASARREPDIRWWR
jgi:nitroreductase